MQLVFLSLMVLLWGLRESNQVDHLKVSASTVLRIVLEATASPSRLSCVELTSGCFRLHVKAPPLPVFACFCLYPVSRL